MSSEDQYSDFYFHDTPTPKRSIDPTKLITKQDADGRWYAKYPGIAYIATGSTEEEAVNTFLHILSLLGETDEC
jgi:hypothetical protein